MPSAPITYVTRAKVYGCCSKNIAQERSIEGSAKSSAKAPSFPRTLRAVELGGFSCHMPDCYNNSKKFKGEVISRYLSEGRQIAGRVGKEAF